MRVLLDSCVWPPTISEIRQAGHDVEHVNLWGYDPGDDEILARCVQEQRVLVTLDNDFGELVFVFDQPHCGIVRLVNIRASEQGKVVVRILAAYEADLVKGALVVAKTDRTRIRLPPKSQSD